MSDSETDTLSFEGPKEDICTLGDLDLRHCLHCNSTNKEYISLPSLTTASFDDMTVSIWAKIFSHNPDMHNRTYLYDLRGDNSWSNQGLSLSLEQINGQTEVHYAISYAPRKWTELCAVIPSPINKWTHFAFVRQGSEFRTYINGEEVEELKMKGNSMASSQPTPLASAGARLGTASTANRARQAGFLNGLLTEFCVWRRALTREELKEQMWVLDRYTNQTAAARPPLPRVSLPSSAPPTDLISGAGNGMTFGLEGGNLDTLGLSDELVSGCMDIPSGSMRCSPSYEFTPQQRLVDDGLAWYWPLNEGDGVPHEAITDAAGQLCGPSWAVSTISPPSYEETFDQPVGMSMCRSFVNNKKFSDVQFDVGGQTVYAHRVVLAMHSPYFRAIFEGPWFETQQRRNFNRSLTANGSTEKRQKRFRVELPDVPLNAFLFMLEWMYVGSAKIPGTSAPGDDNDGSTTGSEMKVVVEILQCADKFGVVPLKQKCIKILKQSMTLDNVAMLLELGTQLMLDSMVEACLGFVFGNWEVLKDSADLKNGILENVFSELAETFQNAKFY